MCSVVKLLVFELFAIDCDKAKQAEIRWNWTHKRARVLGVPPGKYRAPIVTNE